MTNKEKYRAFCSVERNIPIFSKDWYLDSVCGEDNWNVALVEKGGKIVASLPYYIKKKFIFTISVLPIHVQTLGIYIKYPKGQKYEKRLSYEKEIITILIEQLPKVDYFEQSFHYSFRNWLPLYWKGYKQTTLYTYIIEDISNIDKVINNFSNGKRRDIKKAENIVEVKFDLGAEEFYLHHKKSLEKQNKKIAYTFESFNTLYQNSYLHNAGRTIYAIDNDGNIHGAIFFIWDNQSGYYLTNSVEPDFRSSGSMALLVKNILEFLSTKTKKFDFEGSMIEPVEKSYRQFGTTQQAYFNITKIDSKLLKLIL